MPATYYIYPRRRVAVVTWRTRTPDLAQWQTVVDGLIADSSFRDDFGVVSDWRAVSDSPRPDFIRQAIEYASQQPRLSRARWASVLPVRVVSAVLDENADLIGPTDGFVYRVFTSFDEAVAWAGRADERRTRAAAPGQAYDVDALIAEAIGHLDAILEEHAVGFVLLDRPSIIERMERVRESCLAARTILAERRSLIDD